MLSPFINISFDTQLLHSPNINNLLKSDSILYFEERVQLVYPLCAWNVYHVYLSYTNIKVK